jgi:uncharacterized membrane protein
MAKRKTKPTPPKASGRDRTHNKTHPTSWTMRITTPPLIWLAAGLGAAGLLLTAYLTGTRWFGEHPAYCGAGSGCDLVQDSRWSTLLGLPLSLWGFLLYAALLAYLWRMRRRPSAWTRALSIAAFGFALSVYLTVISVFVIKAVCLYCLTSFGLITAILAVLVAARPANLQAFQWRTWAPSTVGTTAVLVTLMHLHYSGIFDPAAGPEEPFLQELVAHLETTGAEFYGASWCIRCEEQKSLFHASAHRLPYVECSPNGRAGVQNFACITQNIQHYPTWIVAGRRHEGVLTPQTLARLSEFKWQAAE